MPPRSRRARGRAAAAPMANDSSDSEPEQPPQQPPSPDPEMSNNNNNDVSNINDTSNMNISNANNNDSDEEAQNHNDDNNNNNNNPNLPDSNTLRILLSTDNHLGYLEKDPIRGNDSFAALEEVLSLARLHHVDFVLLAGDLFHDNKPSRRTLHTTMEILRRYCMGSEPVKVQIVSDQKECLRSIISGRANYEDEFYSVDLPIFTIHGNHDDPTRDGSSELLSAIDLLSVSNLVNYFGRQDAVDDVRVSPILLRKGGTRVALYGMGSMRDERLNRMWQGKKVRFLRPEGDMRRGVSGGDDDDDDDEVEERDWFNIFTLHQNRDLGRGSKNCVHESMIPEWMDLVVWGHEHECNIEPAESLVGTFRITQPGSSVATSLTAGEARRKKVGILDIRGQQFRLVPVPLSSVRAFAVGDVNLGDVARSNGGVLDVEDPKVEERMGDLLAAEVDALIQKARDEAEQLRQDAEAAVQQSMTLEDEFDPDKRQRKYTIKNPEQVLVRLKVEHSGFSTLNNQRFGSKFVGEVANPSDILLFHKRRSAEAAKKGAASKKRSLDIPTEPEDLDEINIEDLITDNLEQSEKKLELLDEKTMGEALNAFVDKEEKRAIEDAAERILKENRKLIKDRQNGEEEEDSELNPNLIREMCASRTQEKNAAFLEERETQTAVKKKKKPSADAKASAKKRNDDHDSLSDDSDEMPPPKKSRGRATTTAKKKPAKSRKKADSSDEDFSEEEIPKPTKRKAPAKAATSRKKKRQDSDSDDEIEFMGTQTSKVPARATSSRARSTAKKPKYNYDDDDDDSVEEVPPTKSKGRAISSRSTAKKTKYNYFEDEAIEDDDYVEETPVEKPKSRSTTTSRAKTATKPKGRGRAGRVNLYDDSDSDDDQPQTGGWGVANSQASRRRR